MMAAAGAGERNSLTHIARVAIFAALAFGVNAPFWAIPNIETFSLALFMSGLFLGFADGIAAAFVAGIIFIFFNPNGPQPVIVIGIVQVIGFALFALFGAILRRFVLSENNKTKLTIVLAACGLFLTFWYDLSTNLAFALLFGPFWPTIIGGLAFSALHLVTNTILFALSGLIIRGIWRRLEYYLPPLAS